MKYLTNNSNIIKQFKTKEYVEYSFSDAVLKIEKVLNKINPGSILPVCNSKDYNKFNNTKIKSYYI